mmetsp:Transcript_11059/g.41304  ORF Transcript_11059/g.41304 Transcript_11059/m.41304 type:complete len:345 (-) Transcript_11059:1574-2608(-)
MDQDHQAKQHEEEGHDKQALHEHGHELVLKVQAEIGQDKKGKPNGQSFLDEKVAERLRQDHQKREQTQEHAGHVLDDAASLPQLAANIASGACLDGVGSLTRKDLLGELLLLLIKCGEASSHLLRVLRRPLVLSTRVRHRPNGYGIRVFSDGRRLQRLAAPFAQNGINVRLVLFPRLGNRIIGISCGIRVRVGVVVLGHVRGWVGFLRQLGARLRRGCLVTGQGEHRDDAADVQDALFRRLPRSPHPFQKLSRQHSLRGSSRGRLGVVPQNTSQDAGHILRFLLRLFVVLPDGGNVRPVFGQALTPIVVLLLAIALLFRHAIPIFFLRHLLCVRRPRVIVIRVL